MKGCFCFSYITCSSRNPLEHILNHQLSSLKNGILPFTGKKPLILQPGIQAFTNLKKANNLTVLNSRPHWGITKIVVISGNQLPQTFALIKKFHLLFFFPNNTILREVSPSLHLAVPRKESDFSSTQTAGSSVWCSCQCNKQSGGGPGAGATPDTAARRDQCPVPPHLQLCWIQQLPLSAVPLLCKDSCSCN